ncbi:conserved hypothetical protein [Trichinella spiralis]|uniref:hypothetical protein n=1 Tax=Trichinella spiralis TaxID=6334 RepID=UPI0001EFB71D|nr:conserved hypothetical protein [Trichinella spiralis]
MFSRMLACLIALDFCVGDDVFHLCYSSYYCRTTAAAAVFYFIAQARPYRLDYASCEKMNAHFISNLSVTTSVLKKRKKNPRLYVCIDRCIFFFWVSYSRLRVSDSANLAPNCPTCNLIIEQAVFALKILCLSPVELSMKNSGIGGGDVILQTTSLLLLLLTMLLSQSNSGWR